METWTCSSCGEQNKPHLNACGACGTTRKIQQPQEAVESTALPKLTLYNYNPRIPVGNANTLGFRVEPHISHYSLDTVKLEINAPQLFESIKTVTLIPKKNGTLFETLVPITPEKAGQLILEVKLDCCGSNRQRTFSGQTTLTFLSNEWHGEIIREGFRKPEIEVENEAGVMRFGGKMGNVGKITSKNKSGVTHFADDIEFDDGTIERVIELAECQAHLPQPMPDRTQVGYLRNSDALAKAGITRIFALPEIVLGRAKAEKADLWLSLFPVSEHLNELTMFSKQQAIIRTTPDFAMKDPGAVNANYLNQKPVGAFWEKINNGDVIGLADSLLELKVEKGDDWLLLERVDNGTAIENYLFLSANSRFPLYKLMHNSQPIDAQLSHEEGGFTIKAKDSSLAVNQTSVQPEQLAGLQNRCTLKIDHFNLEFSSMLYS